MALAVGRSCFYWCQKAFCWVSFSPSFSTIPQAGQRGLNNTVKRMCREAFHPLVGEFSNIENCSLRSALSKNNKRWEGPTAPLGSLSTLNLGKKRLRSLLCCKLLACSTLSQDSQAIQEAGHSLCMLRAAGPAVPAVSLGSSLQPSASWQLCH